MFYNGDNGSWLSYDAATGDYIPLQNPERPDSGDSTSCKTESEPETDAEEDEVSSSDSPSSPKISDTKNENEEANKEPRELSEGEVSTPPPPYLWCVNLEPPYWRNHLRPVDLESGRENSDGSDESNSWSKGWFCISGVEI